MVAGVILRQTSGVGRRHCRRTSGVAREVGVGEVSLGVQLCLKDTSGRGMEFVGRASDGQCPSSSQGGSLEKCARGSAPRARMPLKTSPFATSP